jgi:phage gpG-like protein
MSKLKLDKVLDAFKKGKTDLPNLLGVQAVNFFNSSFKKQAWEDTSLQHWKKRLYDRSARDKTRKILVDTGRLRRAVSTSLKSVGYDKIVFRVDVPYGVYHNEGTSKLPQRKFMGDSKKLRKMQISKIKQVFNSIWQQ